MRLHFSTDENHVRRLRFNLELRDFCFRSEITRNLRQRWLLSASWTVGPGPGRPNGVLPPYVWVRVCLYFSTISGRWTISFGRSLAIARQEMSKRLQSAKQALHVVASELRRDVTRGLRWRWYPSCSDVSSTNQSLYALFSYRASCLGNM